MNAKLVRLLDEIQKTEEKIAAWQEHLKELNMRRKQMEDAEIIKGIRSMKLDSRRMLKLLDGIQDGTVSIQSLGDDGVDDFVENTDAEGNVDVSGDMDMTGNMDASGNMGAAEKGEQNDGEKM